MISADQGANSKKSEKLPTICRAFGVTHVILSRGLHNRNSFYKSLAISTMWEHLHSLADEPRETGYKISMHGEGFRLTKSVDALPEGEIIDPSAELHQQDFGFQ